jgi:hypothetical protein
MPRGDLAQATGSYRSRSYAQIFREKLDELDAAIQQADFDFATTYSTDWRGDSPADPGLNQSIFFKYWRPFVSAWGRAREQLRTGKADRVSALALAYWADHFVDLKRSAGASLGLYTTAPDVVIKGDASIGADDDRATLFKRVNRRFWARTNYKPGQRLDMADPNDRAMAKVWLRVLAEIEQEDAAGSATLATLAVPREQARSFAQHAEARVVGAAVRASGQWYTPTFATTAEAAAWLDRVRAYPTDFAYAAYFDKTDPMWPFPVGEAIGQAAGRPRLAAPLPVS